MNFEHDRHGAYGKEPAESNEPVEQKTCFDAIEVYFETQSPGCPSGEWDEEQLGVEPKTTIGAWKIFAKDVKPDNWDEEEAS